MTMSGYKDIDKITPIDWVLSYNEKLGVNEYRRINNIFVLKDMDEELYRINTDDTYVEATQYHRFYVVNDASYVAAKELKVGDNITYISRANGYENITEGMVITHKLISIDEERGVKKYTTQGIVNPIPDVPITFDQIYGKVVYKTAILSYIGRIINNKYVYYISFIVIGLIVSIEVVAAIFESKREDDDADE